MKTFITMQVGYTRSEMYGLTNELFTTIVIDGDNIKTISFYGLYGAEERINRALVNKGFEQKYIPSDYGRMKRKDINENLFISEEKAISAIEKDLCDLGFSDGTFCSKHGIEHQSI